MSDEAWCSTCTQMVPIEAHPHFQTDEAHLSTLSARVVEAAVGWRLDSIHPGVKLVVNETPMLNATQEDVALVAAVDALIAAREGR